MIATIMSTLHSYIFISGTTIGNDIISRLRNIKDVDNRFSKIGIIITSLVSLLIVILIPSVVDIWYSIGSVIIPALLISILSSYTKKFIISRTYILTAMITAFSISMVSLIYGQFNLVEGYPVYLFELEPMYPGLFAGILIYLLGFMHMNLLKKTKIA